MSLEITRASYISHGDGLWPELEGKHSEQQPQPREKAELELSGSTLCSGRAGEFGGKERESQK